MDDFLEFIVVVALVVIPALAVTARIALRPIVDSIARLREAFAEERGGIDRDRRLAVLEKEVSELRRTVQRLSEAEAFYAELEAPRARERIGGGEGVPEGPEAG